MSNKPTTAEIRETVQYTRSLTDDPSEILDYMETLLDRLEAAEAKITALEAEKVELPHTNTCQAIVIDSQHCDCHRRALCDCPECIQMRNERLKQESD